MNNVQPMRGQFAANPWITCSQSQGSPQPIRRQLAGKQKTACSQSLGNTCSQSQDTYLQPVTGHPAAVNRLHVPSPTGTRTACSQSQDTYFHPVTGHSATVNSCHTANCGRNEVQDKSHILTQQTVGGTRYKTNHTSSHSKLWEERGTRQTTHRKAAANGARIEQRTAETVYIRNNKSCGSTTTTTTKWSQPQVVRVSK